jgi:nicotinate-nucleotide pyrophosphorylase (carboxylating)
MNSLPQVKIDALLKLAFQEDIGRKDITTQAILSKDYRCTGSFLAKEKMILAGLKIVRRGFLLLDKKASFQSLRKEGDLVKKGEIIARVRCKISVLLKAERTVLNILQRLSGIATLTYHLSKEIEDFPCQLLDTRKTTPGLRAFEKYAVRIGGGKNHRFGLFDKILIKENHITAAGSISQALERARVSRGSLEDVEIEVRNLKELKEALRAGAKQILLDNFNLKAIRKAVGLSSGKATLEASGNIDWQNLRKVAQTGVDYISMGFLTHSPKSVDISFMIHPKKCMKK